MKWRLLKRETCEGLLKEAKNKAAMQMAIDEAIAIAHSERKVINTLRFYTFNPAAITIGVHQDINKMRFAEPVKKYEFVRRATGGTSVLHKDDLTYSIIVSKNYVPPKVTEAYKKLSTGIVKGLNLLGVKAEHRLITLTPDRERERTEVCYANKNQYDIVVNGKKISGNAMCYINNAVLQQGTIIIEDHIKELIRCFRLGEEARNKIIKEKKESITSIKTEIGDVFLEDLEEKVREGFEHEGAVFIEGNLTDYEIKKAKELYKTKYSTKQWNMHRNIKTNTLRK